jgi:hypothetical protein
MGGYFQIQELSVISGSLCLESPREGKSTLIFLHIQQSSQVLSSLIYGEWGV